MPTPKTPYKYWWNRGRLYEAMIPQALEFGISTYLLKQICFDPRWNPVEDFNGCTLIQDKYHPFIVCFIHDWRWITGQGGIKSDREFYYNLRKSGMSKFESAKWFLAVRLGWIFYYKWQYA